MLTCFNPAFEHSIAELKKLTDNKVTILGNIPPRDVLASGTPEDVSQAVRNSVEGLDDLSRLVLSCGGGMAPNTSNENINAFVGAATGLVEKVG